MRALLLLALLLGSLVLAPTARAEDPPPYLTQWGFPGALDWRPFGVATGADGNVYIADAFNHLIEEFTCTGVPITQWGSAAPGDALSNPLGVATDPAGNVYVTDEVRVLKFAAAGDYVTEWGPFLNAQGVATDGAGNVYVLDVNALRVEKFNDVGVPLASWGHAGADNGGFESPIGIAADAAGNVFVAEGANSNRVQKFDSSGGYVTQWGGFGADNGKFILPSAVATDPDGKVYVADALQRIQKFDGNGAYLTQWGSFGAGDGQFHSITGIATDAVGNVFVTDQLNHRIQKFGPCPDGRTFANCRPITSGGILFAARYSTDASGFPGEGSPVDFDVTSVTITKEPGVAFFISGSPDGLTDWMCDDDLIVNDQDTGVGFGGSADSLPLCRPIEQINAKVAPRNITGHIPDGTNCVTFKLADTYRRVFGNTAIYLVTSTTVDVDEQPRRLTVSLLPPRPNPARSSINIEFDLPISRAVRLEILDLVGRRLRRLLSGSAFSPGCHRITWDGLDDASRAVPAGIYTVQLTAGPERLAGTITLVR